jgi:uncharacterized membrane protein (UPF0127 family)
MGRDLKGLSRTVRVENRTRGVTLIEHGRLADTFWTRLRGLMGVRHLAAGEGLVITPANQVHTHFMAVALDVFYLDDEGRVLDMDCALAPWRIGRTRPGARWVVETPAGAVAQSGSSVGDQLVVTDEVS